VCGILLLGTPPCARDFALGPCVAPPRPEFDATGTGLRRGFQLPSFAGILQIFAVKAVGGLGLRDVGNAPETFGSHIRRVWSTHGGLLTHFLLDSSGSLVNPGTPLAT